MPYLWPKTFHRPCHDLPGSMIHLVYQDAPTCTRTKKFCELAWTIYKEKFFCEAYDQFSNLEYKSLITSLYFLVAGVC